MYPPLILELLAAENQRELLHATAHERVAAAMVSHNGPWWNPITTTLRHLAAMVVSRQDAQDVRRQVATVERALGSTRRTRP